MIEKNNYTLTVSINGKDIGIGVNEFISFIVTENLNYNCYFAELSLKQNIFWDAISTTSEKMNINIMYQEFDIDGVEYTRMAKYDMIVLDYKLYVDSLVLTLVPEFFPKLYSDGIIKGYNDKIENIVKTVCNSIGITNVEIDSSSTEKRLLIQSGESNLKFLKKLSKYVNNYIFFINKNNKACFLPYSKFIKEKKSTYQIHSLSASNIKLENNTYAMQLMGGLGASNYHFDWDSGKMIPYKYEAKGYGVVTDNISVTNNILMGDPTGNKIYPTQNYNINKTQNIVNSKHLFKMILQFDLQGIFDMSLGDTLRLLFSNKIDMNLLPTLTGTYFIYGMSQIFANQYYTHLVCSTPFLFVNVDNFTGNAIPPSVGAVMAGGSI